MAKRETQWGLSGNFLKLLAAFCMTLDHIGAELLPGVTWLRIVGRLAMPIFAFMIAEGCVHTRSKGVYLLRLVIVAVLCQLVYYFVMGDLYQCIFVTFSLSVTLILLLDFAGKRGGLAWVLPFVAFLAAYILCERVRLYVPGFDVDYGIFGVLLPVIAWHGKDRAARFWYFAAGLLLLCVSYGGLQWYALAALLPLALYNGTRGKWKLQYFFYIYYPAHLVIIHFVGVFLAAYHG